MIVGTLVGIDFISIPRTAVQFAQQDAWLAVLVGGLLPLLVLVLIERLGRRFPNMDFIEMSQALFGKTVGSLLVIILSIHMLASTARVIVRFALMDSIYILPQTPLWVICLLLLLVSLYVASQGAKVVGRINELMFYLYLPTFLFFVTPLLSLADYTNLMPLGGTGPANIARGSLMASLYFSRMEFLLVAYFMVTRKDEVLKAGIWAVSFVVASYTLVAATALLVFGSESLSRQMSPLIGIFKAVRYPTVERLDQLFVAAWSVAARPAFNMLCMSGFSLTRVFNLQTRRHLLLVLAIIGTGVFMLTFIPRNTLDVLIYSELFGYTYPMIGLGYPLLYHLAAALQRRKVGND